MTQPRTTLVGGLTTLWPWLIKEPSRRSGGSGTLRERFRANILESLTAKSPQTAKDLESLGGASLVTIQDSLLDLFHDGLITRSRKGNRASPYFYEVTSHD